MSERKKILVCGATGFIGRNVAEQFSQRADFDVVGVHHHRPAYDYPNLRWVEADLTNAADVARVVAGVDVIVQMAATTSGAKDIVARPFIHVTDNAVMNSLLMRAAFEHKVQHFLFPSCSIMYASQEAPHDETSFNPIVGVDARYFGAGWTKIYLEQMCEFYSRLGATRFTAIRHSNIYGPHDKFDLERSHVFGATITKVMTAEDRIVVWGEGKEARDLLYIDDMVDLFARVIDQQTTAYELVCAGVGHAVAIRDLVQRIVTLSGRALAIEYDVTKPTIPTSLCLSHAKAKALFGWEPQTSLDAGITATLNWWRQNIGFGR